MKTFEQLKPEEKEKLLAYWAVKGNMWLRYTILTVILYAGIFIGMPLAVFPYFPLVVVGIYILIAALLIGLIIIYFIFKSLKYIQLAFGVEDSFEDIFEIKKSDISNMKRRWIKVK